MGEVPLKSIRCIYHVRFGTSLIKSPPPTPQTPRPKPYPKPQTPNPKPQTLNPEP